MRLLIYAEELLKQAVRRLRSIDGPVSHCRYAKDKRKDCLNHSLILEIENYFREKPIEIEQKCPDCDSFDTSKLMKINQPEI